MMEVKLRDRLDGMGEGVAEVEDRAAAGLPLVVLDDSGLDPSAAGDQVAQDRPDEGPDRFPAVGEKGQEVGVPDEPVLDALRQAAAKVPGLERLEQVGIDHHHRRLPEGPDEVLARHPGGKRQVDAGLAADRGIDHRQQRGGHLHERQPTEIGRRGEARQVAGHPPADGHHRAAALHPHGHHRVVQPPYRRQVLARLLGGDLDHAHGIPGGLQRRPGGGAVGGGDPGVDRQGRPPVPDDPPDDPAEPAHRARLDHDLVGATRQVDVDRGH